MVVVIFSMTGVVESMGKPYYLDYLYTVGKNGGRRGRWRLNSTIGKLVPNIPLAHTDEGREFFLSQLVEGKALL